MPRYQLQISACHRIPERSFFWKGKQFPACARCTGYHLGYLTAPIFLFGLVGINAWWSLAMLLPAHVDGITQGLGWRNSNNGLRLVTGVLAGMAIMSLLSISGKWVGHFILDCLQ